MPGASLCPFAAVGRIHPMAIHAAHKKNRADSFTRCRPGDASLCHYLQGHGVRGYTAMGRLHPMTIHAAHKMNRADSFTRYWPGGVSICPYLANIARFAASGDM